MPWAETAVMLVTTPVSRGLLLFAIAWMMSAAEQELSGPPLDPEDPRWPRF